MVRKIALTSTGPMSGKSTLAKILEREHGFYRADHSLTLVKDFVLWHNKQITRREDYLTAEEVYQDKERWRPLLQEHGYRVGFNSPGQAERWILYALSDFNGGDVVFDSFRGEAQAAVLKSIGFILVQLEIPESVRELRYRTAGNGYEYERSLAARKAHPEIEGGISHPDIRLRGTYFPHEMVARLLREVDDARR